MEKCTERHSYAHWRLESGECRMFTAHTASGGPTVKMNRTNLPLSPAAGVIYSIKGLQLLSSPLKHEQFIPFSLFTLICLSLSLSLSSLFHQTCPDGWVKWWMVQRERERERDIHTHTQSQSGSCKCKSTKHTHGHSVRSIHFSSNFAESIGCLSVDSLLAAQWYHWCSRVSICNSYKLLVVTAARANHSGPPLVFPFFLLFYADSR